MQLFEKITGWLPVIVLGITPIFFLPTTADYYDFNKWALLVASAILILAIWGVRLATSGQLTLYWSPVATAIAAFTLAAAASTLFVSANKAEAAVSPFGVVTFASLLILSLTIPLGEKKIKTLLFWLLSGAAGALSLVALYQAIGAGGLWTPFGSTLGLLGFLLIVFPLVAGAISGAISGVLASLIIAGFLVTLWKLVAQAPPLLPLSAAWSVFLTILGEPLAAGFGVGPENYLSAYTLGKPASLNATGLWSLRYTVSASFALHLATTLGLAGILGVALLLRCAIVPILRIRFSFATADRSLALWLVLLILLVLPPSLPLFVVVVAVLLYTTEPSLPIGIHLGKTGQWFRLVAGGFLILTALVSTYLFARVYLAEVSFAKSIAAINRNDATATYQALLTAVGRNPYPSRYHATLSQTSLSLATAILNRASDTQSPLSDGDRQLVTDFYQQAIAEAKAAIYRAPSSVIAWENLASIYRSFLGIAANADAWTIAALSRAIQLDPANPILRVQLGNVYLRSNRLDQAIAGFQSAIALKEDLANAHYNLAFAYQQKQQYLPAAIEFRKTTQLVRPGSTDADRVAADLAEIMAKLSTQETAVVSQTPVPPAAVTTEAILSPVVEFAPIPTPQLLLPPDTSPPTGINNPSR